MGVVVEGGACGWSKRAAQGACSGAGIRSQVSLMVFVGRKEEPRSVAALDDGRQKGLVASSALYGKGAVSVGLTGE